MTHTKQLFSVLTFIIISSTSHGQWNSSFSSKFRLGLHSGLSSFSGDLGSNNLGMPVYTNTLRQTMGPTVGAGMYVHYQINDRLFLRLNYINSRLQGVREDEWTIALEPGPLRFNSTINDIDVAVGLHLFELFGIHDILSANEFIYRLEISVFSAIGYGTGRPMFYKGDNLVSSDTYFALFGDFGYDISYMISPKLAISIGSRLRLYNSDVIDGHKSSDNFDAFWYHSLGLVVGFNGSSGYRRRF